MTPRRCARVLASCVGAILMGCVTSPARARDAASARRCALEGFTVSPSEHIVVQSTGIVRVQAVEGTVRSAVGEWPEGATVLFEIRAAGRDGGEVVGTQADADGHFRIPGLEPGEYCFKVTANGWQSVTGTLDLSSDADRSARIEIEMRLGL